MGSRCVCVFEHALYLGSTSSSTIRGIFPGVNRVAHSSFLLCIFLRRGVFINFIFSSDPRKRTPQIPPAGRFGIGFNSVYHLTELPAFVSAGKWCTFDPQAKFLPNVNPANPGKMVDFLQYQDTVRRYSDQVCVCACACVRFGIYYMQIY